MTHSEFCRLLREGRDYRTPEGTAQPFWSRPGLARLRSQGETLRQIVRCANGVRRGDPYEAVAASGFAILRAVEEAGGQFETEGLAHLARAPGPMVVLANHLSMLDTLVLPAILMPVRPTAIVLKQSLMKYPFFGRILHGVEAIAITRTQPRADLKTVLAEGRAALEGDRHVLIFPEGTRRTEFNPANFSSIGARLAARSGFPVLPLALRTDIWENGRLLKDFGPVHPERPMRLAIGEPLSGADPKVLQQGCVDFIRERLRAWGLTVREEAPDAESPAPREVLS